MPLNLIILTRDSLVVLDRATYLKHASRVDEGGVVAECVIRFVEQGSFFTEECYDITVRILKSLDEGGIAELVARKPENAQFPYAAIRHAYIVYRKKRVGRFSKKYEFQVDLDLITDFGRFYYEDVLGVMDAFNVFLDKIRARVPASVIEKELK